MPMLTLENFLTQGAEQRLAQLGAGALARVQPLSRVHSENFW